MDSHGRLQDGYVSIEETVERSSQAHLPEGRAESESNGRSGRTDTSLLLSATLTASIHSNGFEDSQ